MLVPFVIFFIFIGIPAAEIAGFVYIGGAVGVVPTILLTILTAIAGTMLLRLQGFAVLRTVMSDFSEGHLPAGELIHGVLILLAALCLLIPGFFTDAIGLLLFIPIIRVLIGRFVLSELIRRRATVVQESSDDFHQIVIELDHKEQDVNKGKSSSSPEEADSDGQTNATKE